MEPLVVGVAVVLLVLRLVARPYMRRRQREAGLALRKRLTGSSEPSTTGTYVVAAFFGAFGLYLLVFQTTDVTKGVPGWLSGAVLVVGSVVVAVTAPGRR